jgi:hypothetical protein
MCCLRRLLPGAAGQCCGCGKALHPLRDCAPHVHHAPPVRAPCTCRMHACTCRMHACTCHCMPGAFALALSSQATLHCSLPVWALYDAVHP